ncbi:hypothetical protein pb186bvf_001474 [Paramecium bursaria]
MQNYQNSITMFDQAMKINANDPIYYKNKGLALQSSNQLVEAKIMFEKAKQLEDKLESQQKEQ